MRAESITTVNQWNASSSILLKMDNLHCAFKVFFIVIEAWPARLKVHCVKSGTKMHQVGRQNCNIFFCIESNRQWGSSSVSVSKSISTMSLMIYQAWKPESVQLQPQQTSFSVNVQLPRSFWVQPTFFKYDMLVTHERQNILPENFAKATYARSCIAEILFWDKGIPSLAVQYIWSRVSISRTTSVKDTVTILLLLL